jgi:hypothetical protein
MLTLNLKASDAKPRSCHGSCVVNSMSHEEVLALPPEERQKLRLNETGQELMLKLLDHDIA